MTEAFQIKSLSKVSIVISRANNEFYTSYIVLFSLVGGIKGISPIVRKVIENSPAMEAGIQVEIR